MKTEKKRRRPGSPVGAGRRAKDAHLAALTRANHDLRSPLSVILGVFELLEDTGSLRDGEKRYVRLGSEAAAELLSQADALRLYSAMARKLVSLDTAAVDLQALIRERLLPPLERRNVKVFRQPGNSLSVGADPGYLGVALAGLAKHLAAHLPEARDGTPLALELHVARRDESVTLTVHPAQRPDPPDRSENLTPGEVDLTAVNAATLVALMGGTVTMNAQQGYLFLEVPATG